MALIKFHSSQPLLSKTLTPCLCPKSFSNYGAHLNHVHCVPSEGEQICAWAPTSKHFLRESPCLTFIINFFDNGSWKFSLEDFLMLADEMFSAVQIRCSSVQAQHKLSWYVWESNTCKWQATSCHPTFILNQLNAFCWPPQVFHT